MATIDGELLEQKYRKLLLETLTAEAFFEDFDDEAVMKAFDIWTEHHSNAPEQGCVTFSAQA
ncbi:hypothetical protein GTA08_BOTSDO01712 [Botryosphaeria dothidea]|uniref:Uncharacterized protein n=1 Tax=Botryosphaeria dothidea TaxID=55169 RepID=A0A8H4N775_9PEZI|nr:hypothetical protein GTA08_BOTSDO01712 [Botryosphaeria dothidea]